MWKMKRTDKNCSISTELMCNSREWIKPLKMTVWIQRNKAKIMRARERKVDFRKIKQETY